MFEEEEEAVDFNTLVQPTAPDAPLPLEAPVEEAPVEQTEEVDFNSLLDEPEQAENVEEPIDFSTIAPDPEENLSQKQVIDNPEKIDAVRAYMIDRQGKQWLDRSPEEVMDAYVSHMRWVNANEVRTIGEYIYVTGGDDNRKEVAANAYRVYDELSSFLSNDGVGGAVEGALDYTGAVLLSPSTWIGGLVGKTVGMAGSTAAKKAIMDVAVTQAFKAGGATAAREVIKGVARQQAFKTAGAATLTDGVLNVGADAVYQMTMMEAGVQDDYSLFQGAVAATGGLVGGAVTYLPEAMRGVSGMSFAKEGMKVAKDKRKAAAAGEAAPKIGAAVKELSKKMKEWKKMVDDGAKHGSTRDDMLKYTEWFFDPTNPKSPVNIVIESGADFNKETPFTHQAIEFVRGLPAKSLKAYNKELEPLGIKFGELLDIVADSERVGGTSLGLASAASRNAKKAADLIAANRRADTNIVRAGGGILDTPETENAANPQSVRYIQSLWRRLLVSHPGTTMVNVMGWSQAYGARTLAEIIHGGVLGAYGLAGQVVGGKFGSKQLQQSKHLMKNQAFKARTLLDPYTSREAFEELLKQTAPKRLQDSVFRDYFGGVGQDPATFYGMNPKSRPVAVSEKIADVASKATLVKAQDTWTKTFSGLSELDLTVRMEYGIGLDEMIRTGQSHMITDEIWDRTVTTLLKDTFSMDYAKGNGSLNKMARMVETSSDIEGLGFLFPFGKFMNNTIAFTFEYSPLGLLPIASKIGMKSFTKDGRKAISEMNPYTIQEKLMRATAGTVGLMMLMDYSAKTQAEGMQWNEVEDSGGTVTNRSTLAPASTFLLASRMLNLMQAGETVPPELWQELGLQLGPGAYLREITGQNAITEVIDIMSNSSPEEAGDYQRLLVEGIAALGGFAAGATRPLDVPNRIVGMATENNVAIDKRQSSGLEAITLALTKYTTNLFAPFIGEPVEEGGPNLIGTPLRVSTQPGDIRDPNPVASALGRKEQPARGSLEILLGMVNFPAWKANQRTAIPEFDAFVNERVQPMLELRAARLLKDPRFEKMSRGEKLAQTQKLMLDARNDVEKYLETGEIGDNDARLNNLRRIWTTLPEIGRIEARREFNVSTPDKDLSQFQIEMMRNYMKERENYSDYIRENE